MIRLLQSKWMAVAIGAVAYLVATWLSLQPQKHLARIAAEARASAGARHSAPSGPSWNFDNPEMVQLVAELKDQRESLRTRALQLDELEARLKAERQEIYSVTQAVYQLKTNIEASITRVGEEEAVNLKKLAKVYAAMSPDNAARILREMDDDQVVRIMALMKESESAPVLEILGQGARDEPKRAAMLSNRLRLTIVSAASRKVPPP